MVAHTHSAEEQSVADQLKVWFGKKVFEDPVIKEKNEMNSLVLNKFYSGQAYTKLDMDKCIIVKDIHVISDPELLEQYLDRFSGAKMPLFKAVYDINVCHWVLLYIENKKDEGFHVYCKDPQGGSLGENVKNRISRGLLQYREPNPMPEFKYYEHRKNDLEEEKKGQDESVSDSTGAMCLRNIDKMDEFFVGVDREEAFYNVEFVTKKKLDEEKLQRVTYLAHELVEDEEFMDKVNKVETHMPDALKVGVSQFRSAVEKQVKTEVNCMDPIEYKGIRESHIKDEELDKFKDYNGDKGDQGDNPKTAHPLLEIFSDKKFKGNLDNFKDMMNILSKADKSECLETVTGLIKVLFGTDCNSLFDIIKGTGKQDKNDYQEPIFGAKMRKKAKQDSTEKTLGEIVSGLLKENEEKWVSEDTNKILRTGKHEKYYNAIQEWVDKIKKEYSTLEQINQWAKDNIDKEKDLLANDFEKIVAIVIWGYSLVKGYEIRIPHLFTLILALKGEIEPTDTKRGKIFQVQTGEGKTNIVALLAILKVIQGKKVDVITSNTVLAEEGVNESRTLYETFGISVDHNNPDDFVGEIRTCYKSDVVYGSISTFQFDYLKDKAEGFQNRFDRQFQEVILDEVDNMLIDNGGFIAKLAEPFPGMESFRYIYLHIWIALEKAEKEYREEISVYLKEKANEEQIDENKELTEEEVEEMQVKFQAHLKEFSGKEVETLKGKILKYDPIEKARKMIPSWLLDYAKDNINTWIENAIYAKNSCEMNVNYKVDRPVLPKLVENEENHEITEEDKFEDTLSESKEKDEPEDNIIRKGNQSGVRGLRKVIPIDYENTGISLTNTIWSDGLHQFMQLKHNLHLTYENLTSSFISNIGYIQLYDNPKGNITGLTGTVGSKAEQELLSKIYNINFFQIPTFKERIFDKDTDLVVPDRLWARTVVEKTLAKILKMRGVLIICETIKDAQLLQKQFQKIQEKMKKITVRWYYDESHAQEKIQQKEKYIVKPGTIILATNLAGRGTDFKITKDVANKGGLHVIVGFLPCNLRVQEQAFGRTSRTGQPGTAHVIMKSSQATTLLGGKKSSNFQEIVTARDEIETERLDRITKTSLQEIRFKDSLFHCYAKHYLEQKNILYKKGPDGYFFMRDFKEQWAFWMKQQNFSHDKIKNEELKPEEEFARFIKGYNSRYIKNPYYKIVMAEEYMGMGELEEAKKILKKVLDDRKSDVHLLSAVYFKMFDIEVQSGKQLEHPVLKLLLEIFDLKPDPCNPYKEKSLSYLEEAKSKINVEIEYLEANFLGESKKVEEINLTEGMQSIMISGKNTSPLIKHLFARRSYLQTLHELSDKLISDIKSHYIKQDKDFFIECKSTLQEMAGEKKNKMYPEDCIELSNVGLSCVYVIKNTTTIPDPVKKCALAMFISGVALMPVACLFPVWISVAVTLISEAICDLIFALFVSEYEDFKAGPYIRDKLITIGSTIFMALVNPSSIVAGAIQKAINFCKAVKRVLDKIPFIREVIDAIKKVIDKIETLLQKILDGILKVPVKMTPKQALQSIAKGVGKNVFKYSSTLLIDKVSEVISENMLSIITNAICTMLDNDSKLKIKLKNSNEIDARVLQITDKILEKGEFKKLSNKLSTVTAKHSGKAAVAFGCQAIKSIQSAGEILTIAEFLAQDLTGTLSGYGGGTRTDADVSSLNKSISAKAGDKIMNLLKGIGEDCMNVIKEKDDPKPSKPAPGDKEDLASGICDYIWETSTDSSLDNVVKQIDDFAGQIDEYEKAIKA